MFSLYGSSTWPRTLDGGWRHPGRAYRRDDEDSAAEPAADTGEQLPNDSTSSDTEASDRSGHADTSSAEPELSVAGTEPAINDGDRRTAVHDIEEQTHNRDDHIWNGTSHFTREDVDDAYDQLTHTEDGERRPARDIAEIWNHLDRHSRDKLTESDPFKDTRAGGDDADDYPDVAANRQLLLDALAAGGPFGSYGYNLDEQAGGLDVDLWVPKGASDVLRAMVLELEDAMQDSVDLFGMGKPQSAPMLADIVNNDVLEADEESWADVIENHSQLEAMVYRWEQLGRMRNLEVNRTEIDTGAYLRDEFKALWNIRDTLDSQLRTEVPLEEHNGRRNYRENTETGRMELIPSLDFKFIDYVKTATSDWDWKIHAINNWVTNVAIPDGDTSPDTTADQSAVDQSAVDELSGIVGDLNAEFDALTAQLEQVRAELASGPDDSPIPVDDIRYYGAGIRPDESTPTWTGSRDLSTPYAQDEVLRQIASDLDSGASGVTPAPVQATSGPAGGGLESLAMAPVMAMMAAQQGLAQLRGTGNGDRTRHPRDDDDTFRSEPAPNPPADTTSPRDEPAGPPDPQAPPTEPPAAIFVPGANTELRLPDGTTVRVPSVVAHALEKELHNPNGSDARAAYAGTPGELTPAHLWVAVEAENVRTGDIVQWTNRTALVVVTDHGLCYLNKGVLTPLDPNNPVGDVTGSYGAFQGFYRATGANTDTGQPDSARDRGGAPLPPPAQAVPPPRTPQPH